MNLLTQNMGRLWSSIIINEVVKQGAKHFFVSPGQRNAPIIAAISNHPEAKIHLGIDERGQGYRALGFSKSNGLTSVLVCTSGTALSNFFPSVIEAKKSQTPMFIISADRPWDMVFANANQTISQDNLFGKYVNAFLNPGEPNSSTSPLALSSSIAHLYHQGLGPIPGPVHLNLPLREPLENELVEIDKGYLDLAKDLNKKKFSFVGPKLIPGDLDLAKEKIRNAKSPLLVIGLLPTYKNLGNIRTLIRELNWPFYLDVCSGLKFEFNLMDGATPGIDHPEVFNIIQKNPPDLILHIGGGVVSKHYYSFLQKNPDTYLIGVNNSLEKEDPAHSLNLFFQCDPELFALDILSHLPKNHVPRFSWEELIEKKSQVIDSAPLTYPQVSKSLLDWIPEFSTLYIGNSTAIRSFDSYSTKSLRKKLKIMYHRGVSGIEGFIAGAVGASEFEEIPLTLVIGDISFLYDLNSLTLLKETKNPIITLILNNKGGGIFSLLPIAKEKEILPYLYTGHELNFQKTAEQFGLNYHRVFDIGALKEQYLKAVKEKKHAIIEVEINNDENVLIYQKLKTIKL